MTRHESQMQIGRFAGGQFHRAVRGIDRLCQLALVAQAQCRLRHRSGELEERPADGHGDEAGALVDGGQLARGIGIHRGDGLVNGIPMGQVRRGISLVQRGERVVELQVLAHAHAHGAAVTHLDGAGAGAVLHRDVRRDGVHIRGGSHIPQLHAEARPFLLALHIRALHLMSEHEDGVHADGGLACDRSTYRHIGAHRVHLTVEIR